MNSTPDQKKRLTNEIPWWAKSIVLLAITGVLCYKIIITPFDLVFDFPALLSLLLALFSVGLAAMFYFKATDTSNEFYNNTYKFTQDMNSILVKIQSSFGEKLSYLSDSYAGMLESLDRLPGKINFSQTKEELAEGEQEIEKIQSDKNKLLSDLMEKAKLADEEKEKFFQQLKSKEQQIQTAKEQIRSLYSRLVIGDVKRGIPHFSEDNLKFIYATIKESMIRKHGIGIFSDAPDEITKKLIEDSLMNANPMIRYRMIELNHMDEFGILTETGFKIFKKLIIPQHTEVEHE